MLAVNKYLQRIFLVLGIFYSINFSHAQLEGNFYHLDYSKGLTNLFIKSIVQDNDGFIWVGTDDGLFRYDGYNFKIFQNKVDNSTSLSNNVINCLKVDSNGKLWVATKIGLNIYDSENESFYQFLMSENDPQALPNNLVETLYEDKNGTVWIGHYDGLLQLKNKNDAIEDYIFENIRFVDSSNVRNWISSICEDEQGNIWCGAFYNGIYKIDGTNKEIKSYYNRSIMPKYFKTHKIFLNQTGKISVSSFTEGCIYEYNLEKDIFQKTYLTDGEKIYGIYDILKDNNESIWVASGDGLWQINEKKQTSKVFKHNSLNKETITSNVIKSIFIDNANNLWIGTAGKGIDVLAKPSIKITTFNKQNNSNFPDDLVSGMIWIDESLYFATQVSGVFQMSEGKIIRAMNNGGAPLMLYDGKRVFSERDYFNITDKKSGRIFEEIKHVSGMAVSSTNQLHMLTAHDFIRFDKNDLKIQKRLPINESLFGRNVFKIFSVDTNQFLFLGKSTLSMFRYPSGLHKELWNAIGFEGNEYGFKDMCMDGDICWIISNKYLYKFHLKTGLQAFYSKDLFWGQKLYTLAVDNDHDVWLVTNEGIILFEVKNEKSFLFNEADGLSTIAFSGVIAVSPENKVHVGTGEGIEIIDKESFQPNTDVPELVFTNFQIFNEDIDVTDPSNCKEKFCLSRAINEIDQIYLKYNQNFFNIEFAAINYRMSSKNQYKYYLEGLEETWSNPGSKRKVSYNGLAPGKYIFKVMGANNDGVWKEQARELKIIIHPPFWATIWFRTLLVLTVFLIFVLIFGFRMRSIKKKKEKLENLVRQRTVEIVAKKEEIQTQAENLQEINALLRENQDEVKAQAERLYEANTELQLLNNTKDKFFNIIAHDLRNPFQAIDGFTEIILKRHEQLEPDEILKFICNIKISTGMASELLGNLMEWAKSQTNKIEFSPTSISLFNIAETTINLLKVNAANKKIQLINQVPEKLSAFADKNMTETVVRNLVNNAIKFTPEKGVVVISGKLNEKFSEISIEDTGVGMSEKVIEELYRLDRQASTLGTSGESGTGLGLLICKEFIEKNNGFIQVKSVLKHGSVFTVKLPQSHQVLIKDKESDQKGEEKKVIAENKQQNENKLKEKPILLIVEDSNDVRQGLYSFMASDYKIIEAGDGEEGLKYALEIVPDIVISDWMMPKMDGIGFTKRLKSDNRTSHIPVIMLTARNTPKSKIEGFETGADEYMVKPFDYNVLKVRLKNLIQQRKALQLKFSSIDFNDKKDVRSDSELSSLDKKFMVDLHELILKNLDNSEFSINESEKDLGMSRAQIYRKIKALTGLSPVVYVRNFRLHIAAEQLKKGELSVSEVMYGVGFTNVSYFARTFKEMFACTPKEYFKKEG